MGPGEGSGTRYTHWATRRPAGPGPTASNPYPDKPARCWKRVWKQLFPKRARAHWLLAIGAGATLSVGWVGAVVPLVLLGREARQRYCRHRNATRLLEHARRETQTQLGKNPYRHVGPNPIALPAGLREEVLALYGEAWRDWTLIWEWQTALLAVRLAHSLGLEAEAESLATWNVTQGPDVLRRALATAVARLEHAEGMLTSPRSLSGPRR